MKKEYLIVINMGNGYKVPVITRAEHYAEALYNGGCFCLQEGYHGVGMEHIPLGKDGIIDIDMTKDNMTEADE